MLHSDNLENGMLKFWEKVYDEETEEYIDVEIPACHCSECGEGIYKDDNCYMFPGSFSNVPYVLCEECIDTYVTHGKDAAEAIMKGTREDREARKTV